MSSLRWHDAVTAQEAEALVDDLEDPGRDPRLAVLFDARLAGRQRDHVEQLQHQVRVLELLVALDAVLARQLAQLIDVFGLQVGEVHAALVGVGREGAGEDRGVAARWRSCCAALV